MEKLNFLASLVQKRHIHLKLKLTSGCYHKIHWDHLVMQKDIALRVRQSVRQSERDRRVQSESVNTHYHFVLISYGT